MTAQLITIDAIPGPRGLPLIGNVFGIGGSNPIEAMIALAREYGPIFKLETPGATRLVVSGTDLADEICDDTRFDKKVGGGLANLRKGAAGSGLFTAETPDPLWHRAHNILLPAFSQQSMRDYLPMMLDIAGQLMDKWTRLNPGEDIAVA